MSDRPPPVRPPWSRRRASEAGGTSTQLKSDHQRRRDSQRSRRRSLFPAAAASLVVLATTCVRQAAADDQEQLEIIRAGYVQTITSMRSIWCRYEQHLEMTPKLAERDFVPTRTCEWATEGEKFHYRCDAGVTPSGRPYRPYRRSADGQNRWILEYTSEGQLERALTEKLTDGTWQIRAHLTPGRFLGYYFNVGNHHVRALTLQSILESQPLTLGDLEPIDGHDCWRVDFVYPADATEYERPMIVWFDPAAGYLPRRINDFENTFHTVLTFQQIDDGVGDEPLFFPSSMRHDHPLGTKSLQVLDVKLNERLSPTLFRPGVPAGVKTYNLDDERQQEALSQAKRGWSIEAARARYKAEQERQAKRTAAAAAALPTVDAIPQPPNYAAMSLIVGGSFILLLFTVATVWRKQ